MLKSVKYQKGKIRNNMVTQLLLCAELKSITNTESLSSPPIFPPLNPSSKKVFKGAFPINWILGGKCLVIYVSRFDVSISASDEKKEGKKGDNGGLFFVINFSRLFVSAMNQANLLRSWLLSFKACIFFLSRHSLL